MYQYIPSLEALIDNFRRLPGIGYKTAVRLAFSVLDMKEENARDFAQAIIDVKTKIKKCSCCQDISETDLCDICINDKRDRSVICVVEGSKDIAALEKINEYKGLYHVLGGLLSPIDGIGPEKLNVKSLLARLGADSSVQEIILALNPSIEGEATGMYISRHVKPLGIKVTRLAYGLPAGGELEYADELTLFRALECRQEIE